ncbi:MAG: hypothetical protein Q4C49_02860 [Bacillota bacterium]|nr:hypothetical protein [Bacillota bacterium]
MKKKNYRKWLNVCLLNSIYLVGMYTVNSACWHMLGQKKEPESLSKYKKYQ